jgi:hypothetical protein
MSDDNRGPRERAYDEEINPLMAEIIRVCKQHGIPMFASFELDQRPDRDPDDPLMCTTALLGEDNGFTSYGPALHNALGAIFPARAAALAETHETMPDGSKRITIRRVN